MSEPRSFLELESFADFRDRLDSNFKDGGFFESRLPRLLDCANNSDAPKVTLNTNPKTKKIFFIALSHSFRKLFL